MLKTISRFCTRFPWIVILVVFAITAFFMQQMANNLKFEADVTKSLPTNVLAVKSDDYYKKNFNYKDVMLVGIEKTTGSVMEAAVLRKIEQIVLDIKALKASKTFDSILTGKKETLEQGIGIDTENINSVANLEDAVMDRETGSVVAGSYIEKLKKDHGIVSRPGETERLPEQDQDLKQIIPELTRRILEDRSFKNSLLSGDMHASNIAVSMLRKWDYKKRYTILELSTALSETRLKDRFQGKSSVFPFQIYGKTVAGIQVDDAFIAKQVSDTRQRLSGFLNNAFRGVAENDPVMKDRLGREMTAENFQAIMALTERSDFFTADNIDTWNNFINNIWDFTLERIDPFSRENLEFQLHDVENIFDFAEVYRMVAEVLSRHPMDGVNYYVAGMPVVIGVIGSMMSQDMRTLVPIAVLVIFFILGISFRSLRGIIIPALTVVLSVIWTMGIMAVLGLALKMGTSMLPIILLGVGTAYGIHLLNRYYEDAATETDRRELVQKSVAHVGVAVIMAAITTMAGFSSLATSGLSMIQEFGIFAAVGVSIALILSLTLTPSLLVLWRLPKKKGGMVNGLPVKKRETLILRLMRSGSELVARKPWQTFTILGLIFVVSIILTTGNKFEGSMMKNFDEANPLYQSDQFINENLTGTTNINLLFRFRDRINLDSSQSQSEFRKHLLAFADAWQVLTLNQPELGAAATIVQNIQTDAGSLPGSLDSVMERLKLVQDILNEEFIVEAKPVKESDASLSALDSGNQDNSGGDSLDALSDKGSDDDLSSLSDDTGNGSGKKAAAFADLSREQVAGLKDINRRLGLAEEAWEKTGDMVVMLRKVKRSPAGLQMQRRLNLTTDYLAVDIKQPVVLNKLEALHHFFADMKTPVITIRDKEYTPTGFVMTPVDLVRKFYKVFYHNDDPAFNRLPDVEKDGFTDITLTDRAINGVVLNQALSGNRDSFEGMITPDLKEFQVQIMLRSGSHNVIDKYLDHSLAELKRVFPDDDPYIAEIRIGGAAPTSSAINQMLGQSQVRSILLSFLFVFIVTFFIFRSAVGGLFSLIPLAFTVILNFGLIRLISGEINTSTMMVASISIGTGVDYTIHFLERMKIQLKAGDDLSRAYVNTVMSSGKAILMNASAVALGFLVLVFSVFVPQIMMGILMAATMFFSSIGALVLLPALILLTKPSYLTRLSAQAVLKQEAVAN
ncbi:MAG: MMPL family transporter [bacterium]